MTQQNEAPCPQCGEPLECDEVDVGPGTIRGPVGCPACHWTAPAVTFPPAVTFAANAPADMLDAFKAAGLTVAEVDVSGIEPLLRGHRLATVKVPPAVAVVEDAVARRLLREPPFSPESAPPPGQSRYWFHERTQYNLITTELVGDEAKAVLDLLKPKPTDADIAMRPADRRTLEEHADAFIDRENRDDGDVHLRAVAQEIQRLRSLRIDRADVPTLCAALAPLCLGDVRKVIERLGKGEPIKTRADSAVFLQLEAAIGDAEAAEARTNELLEANTALVEERRVIRQELADAKATSAALARQLTTLHRALEFYADEGNYSVMGQISLISDGGAIAEMALVSVFGHDRKDL